MPLFHPAQQDGGVGAFEEDGLVGGEQGDAAGGEFFFQFRLVEGVPGGAVDVLADHGGECRGGAAGLGEQVGHAPVAGDADAVDGDRLLLVRKTYGNQWDIPGGYVDVGESPAAACQRELREELGIDRQPQRLPVMEWAPKHPAKMTPP